MRGELRPLWPDVWSDLLEPLGDHDGTPLEVYGDLYVAFAPHLSPEPEFEALARSSSDHGYALACLDGLSSASFLTELHCVECVHLTYDVCQQYDDQLARDFVADVTAFARRFSLRYSVTSTGRLRVTAAGVTTGLVGAVEDATAAHPHLRRLLADVQESLQEAIDNPSHRRIRNAIRDQILLLEGLGQVNVESRSRTLGEMCREFGSWPHRAVQKSLESLYGFSSDYPGIRHAGNEAGALREIDLRDLSALTTVLFGFVPYVTDLLHPHAGALAAGDALPGGRA